MDWKEIGRYYDIYAPGCFPRDCADFFPDWGEKGLERAAVEISLGDGSPRDVWADAPYEGNVHTVLAASGGRAYHFALPVPAEDAAAEAVIAEHSRDYPGLGTILDLLARCNVRISEIIYETPPSARVITLSLSETRMRTVFKNCVGRELPYLWEASMALAGAPASLELSTDATDEIRAGVRIFPAHGHENDLLTLLIGAGLCTEAAKKRCIDWANALPNGCPLIFNRLYSVDLREAGKDEMEAAARLDVSERPYAWGKAYHAPVTMNLELTTKCPLRCPQCYCDLERGKELPLDKALYWIREAGREGVESIDLSGGETLCYPYLYEVIEACSKVFTNVNVALSGWHFDEECYIRLLNAGVTGIFISLNGPTREINAQSRDGFELAIDALSLLQKKGYPNTYINWVMHSSNADSFADMVRLAEEYGVGTLVVMAFKPDSSHALPSLPSSEQMHSVAEQIRKYRGPVKLAVECCYSPMLALVSESFFGNLNLGLNRGFGASRNTLSVNVDGLLSPCRHLDYFEKYDTIRQYWTQSPILKKLRDVTDSPRQPCADCRYLNNCLHCMAINSKLNGDIYQGNETCPIAERKG